MGGVDQAIAEVKRFVQRAIGRVTPFRAVVTAVDGNLVEILRVGAVTEDERKYASCTRYLLRVGDVVLCANLDGEPVVIDRIGISPASALATTYTVLSNAGNTATGSIAGDDTSGLVSVTANGTGIAAGTVIEVDFATARPSTNYAVALTRTDLNSGSLDARATGRTVNRFRIQVMSALSAGNTYSWFYQVRQYGN
jgi:hypothetical protein